MRKNKRTRLHENSFKDHTALLLGQRLANRASPTELIERNILESATPLSINEYDNDNETKGNDYHESDLDFENSIEFKLENGDNEKAKETEKHEDRKEFGRVGDESDGEQDDNEENKIIQSKHVAGMRIQGGGDTASIWTEIVQPNNNKKKEGKCKKYIIYSFNLWSRLSSLIDFFTDLLLLYKVMSVSKANKMIIPLAISLFVSIVSPYILSYSSGVKLVLFRHIFDDLKGFYKIGLILFLLPTGVIYFVLIDMFDILLTVYRWLLFVVFGWNEIEIELLEDTLAQQLHMSRMNFIGFKKQRATAQLMFETVPQVILQALLFFEVFSKEWKTLTNITNFELILSIVFACINSITQIVKLYLESKACNEKMISYCLNMVMARIGWLPFESNFLALSRRKNNTKSKTQSPITINYAISYKVFGIFKNKVDYLFSSVTLRHLMATLSIVNVKNNTNDSPNINDPTKNTNVTLSIAFGKSLTLVSFKELLLLFKICKNQGILIKDIDKIDLKNAILQSKDDPRLIGHSRDVHGVPYLETWYNLMPKQYGQMISLLECGMNVNVKNENGESIIFSILRNFDYFTLKYILTRYSTLKKVDVHLNYFNRSGISPLCLALQLFSQEMKMKRFENNRDNKHNLYLFEYLIEFGEVNLNDAIRRDGSSAFGFAFGDLNNLTLVSKLIQHGAILHCKEISLLPQLYVNMSLIDCEIISPEASRAHRASLHMTGRTKCIKEKYKLMQEYVKNCAKYKESLASRKQQVVGGSVAVAGIVASTKQSKLSMVYHLIFKCNIHQLCIVDSLYNNPLHILIHNVNNNNNSRLLKDDLMFKQCNMISLLKFCCREWVYQKNLHDETPFTIALKNKNEYLLQTLLFDELKSLEYIDQLNELNKNLGEKTDDSVYKWKSRPIESKYCNTNGEAIVRNEKLFNLILSNKRDCKLIINWIIDLCNDILSPYTREMSIKNVQLMQEEEITNIINIKNIFNGKIVMLDCKIESENLEQYIDSNRSIRSKLSTLCKLLMMIDYKNIVFSAGETVKIDKQLEQVNQINEQQVKMAVPLPAVVPLPKQLPGVESVHSTTPPVPPRAVAPLSGAAPLTGQAPQDLEKGDDSKFSDTEDDSKNRDKKNDECNDSDKGDNDSTDGSNGADGIDLCGDSASMSAQLTEQSTLPTLTAEVAAPLAGQSAAPMAVPLPSLPASRVPREAPIPAAAPLPGMAMAGVPSAGSADPLPDGTLIAASPRLKLQMEEKNSIDLISICRHGNKLYIIQFLNYFFNFSITNNDKCDIDRYWLFCQKLIDKERKQIGKEIEEERLKQQLKRLQQEKMEQLQSQLKAAVFKKIGVIASKADNEIKENETEYIVRFDNIKQINDGLTFKSLNSELKTDMTVVSCDKDILNEENGMYVDNTSMIVEINDKYVYGLKTSKINKILQQEGEETSSSKGNLKMTIDMKFRVDKMIPEARLKAFEEQQVKIQNQKHQEKKEEADEDNDTVQTTKITTTDIDVEEKMNNLLVDIDTDEKKEASIYDSKSGINLMIETITTDQSSSNTNQITNTEDLQQQQEQQKEKQEYASISALSIATSPSLVIVESQNNLSNGVTSDIDSASPRSFEEIEDIDSFDSKEDDLAYIGQFSAEELKLEQDKDEEDEPVSWLELLYSSVVESLSTADLITDALVLTEFVNGKHLWWSSWMVLLILAPYMVSYVSLGSLFQNRVQRFVSQMEVDESNSKCSLKWIMFTFVAFLLLTPISLIYFVVIDIIFMIYVLISSFLYFFTCSKIDVKDVLDDWIFSKFLGMTRMQILGYRRLRTLSQLLFETGPQLILQARVLYAVRNYETQSDEGGNLSGVDESSLLISIGFAIVHLIFEAMIIYLDSRACDMSFTLYAIECLGARLSWIPFCNTFEPILQKQLESIRKFEEDKENIDDGDDEDDEEYNCEDSNNHRQFYHIFDYESMIAKLGCITYQIEFKFSNESISKLAEYFVYLPSRNVYVTQQEQQEEYDGLYKYGKRDRDSSLLFGSNHSGNGLIQSLIQYKNDEDYMIHVRLGPNCCRNISIFSMAEMYRTGHKKIVFNTNELDWNRIIFKNTFIRRENRIYLSLILREFIKYAEIGPLNVLLQPSLRLGMTTSDVKKGVLMAYHDSYNSDTISASRRIEIDANEYLLLLKKYSDQNILFYNCDETQIIYSKIWSILTSDLINDTSYFVVILLMLYYTQKNIKTHGCGKGCCKLKDYLLKFDNNDTEKNNNKNNIIKTKKEKRETILAMIDSILNCYFYPKVLAIQYVGKSNELNVQCNQKQRLYLSFKLCEMFQSHSKQLENLILSQCNQSAMKTKRINALTERIAVKEIETKLFSQNDKTDVKETEEEDAENVDIGNHTKSDIDKEDNDSTNNRDNEDENDPFSESISNQHGRIIIKSVPNEWFGGVSQVEIDFVEMVISCDDMKRGLPKHKKLLEYFNLLDKLLCHWKMNFSLFYLYTLSQLRYRLTEKMTLESRILAPEISIELENGAANARETRSKTNTTREKESVCQTICIPGEVIVDTILDDNAMWGLKSMSFELKDLLVENLDVVIDINRDSTKLLAPSKCEFSLIINLPISMKQSTVTIRKPLIKNGDTVQNKEIELDYSECVPINWNPIVIGTFELPMTNSTDASIDNTEKCDQIFQCDITDYRGLSLFNPNIYDLNEISFDIRFNCGINRRISCSNMKINIEYFVQSLIDARELKKDDGLLPYAVEEMNIGLIDYLLKHKSLFDVNTTRIQDGNNALHICCMNKSVPVTIMKRLLTAGIDLNHKNKDGYTPIDILHTLRVKSSKIYEKEAMMKLLLENRATYHLIDPNMEFLIDKSFFEEFLYPHSYIPACALASRTKTIDGKLDRAVHKLGYELLFLGQMDAGTANLFVIFEILLSLSQVERMQLCVKYNNCYGKSLIQCIQDLLSSPKFSSEHDIIEASQAITLILKTLCISNQECDASIISSILLDSGKNKRRKKLSVEKIDKIINLVCPKTNYEIRQMKTIFFEKHNEKSASIGMTQYSRKETQKNENSKETKEKDKNDSVKLTRVLTDAIQDSLDIQHTLSEYSGSINNLHGRDDRDKIVSMHALINLLSLKRDEELNESDQDEENIDVAAPFDISSVPFDMLMEYSQRSNIEYSLRDEFDQWFVFLVSECSWQYVWKFCKYFANAYFDFQINNNNSNNNNSNNLQLERKKNDESTNTNNNSKISFYTFAMTQLDLPPLMKQLLHVTLNIAGCGNTNASINDVNNNINYNTIVNDSANCTNKDCYHRYFGKKIEMMLMREQFGNKENKLSKNWEEVIELIVNRSEIDIVKINQMFQLDQILCKQLQKFNNKLAGALKYLLLKLVCADVKLLRNVLSDINHNKKYRVYLPQIEDLREFAKSDENPSGREERSKSLNFINIGDKYVNYPAQLPEQSDDDTKTAETHLSENLNGIRSRDLCDFNANIEQFVEFGLIMHGFENDKRNVVYDGLIGNKDEIKEELQSSNHKTGFIFSKYNESFYDNISDNGTHDRYENLMLIPFFKENFGERNSKYSKFENAKDIKNIISQFWDYKIELKNKYLVGNVFIPDWLMVFKNVNTYFTQSELVSIANTLDENDAHMINKDDFIDFVMDSNIVCKQLQVIAQKDNEFEDDDDDELKSRFVEYIWREARNPVNYKKKFVCRLLLNVLTIEGLPFSQIKYKNDMDDKQSVYCVSCSINSSNLTDKSNSNLSDIVLCYDTNENDTNKKVLFGYPIINKSYIFDSFRANSDSIDISLKFGKISHNQAVIANSKKKMMDNDNYKVEYDQEIFQATGKIRLRDIIDSDENDIVIGSGKDFKIFHSTKLFLKKKHDNYKSLNLNVVYCIQVQFVNCVRKKTLRKSREEERLARQRALIERRKKAKAKKEERLARKRALIERRKKRKAEKARKAGKSKGNSRPTTSRGDKGGKGGARSKSRRAIPPKKTQKLGKGARDTKKDQNLKAGKLYGGRVAKNAIYRPESRTRRARSSLNFKLELEEELN